MRKKVTVLGSTGSIGKQALEVIAACPEEFELFGLAGGNNTALLLEQVQQYRPKVLAGILLPDASRIPPEITCLAAGERGVLELAGMQEADVVVNGISGFAALMPLLASLKAGKRVALANKESIVCGRELVNAACKTYGGQVLPVDSEHSAIFQCLAGGEKGEVANLILTASGGRFWRRSFEELADITPQEALDHPTWNMGPKITIDSASLFNKGLEVIEASYLFDIPGDKIQVLIHPQSIVHSMVEFCDGTILANLSLPDMRLPIQYAMTYPRRMASPCKRLSLADASDLSFHAADPARYPALRLAYEALTAGGTMPTVYNAANEAAVSLFVEGKIRFIDLYTAVEEAMQQHVVLPADSTETVFAADVSARNSVFAWAEKRMK